MAKKSNKKAKRRKARELEEKKLSFQAAQNRLDPYTHQLLKDRKNRKTYFEQLHDAVINAKEYRYRMGVPRDVDLVCRLIADKKLGMVNKRALKRLIEVGKRTNILSVDDMNGDYLTALVHISEFNWMWQRNPDEWKPATKNRERQLSALLRYLFAKYEVPLFMDHPWKVDADNADTANQREWFINIGAGENIRTQRGLPIPMTKKMAHYFLQAPKDVTINEAIRWGQVVALGGDARVARGVLGTLMGRGFVNDNFWATVIKFFIDNPFLDVHHYGPICDYINHKKYTGRRRVWQGDELVTIGPDQPNLTMKRRDPQALLDQVERWHAELNRSRYRQDDYTWDSCGINGYDSKNKKTGKAWVIVELLSTNELRSEGQQMGHCVGSYGYACKDGRTAIFAASHREDEYCSLKKELTIEVDVVNRQILQARKKFNKAPTEKDFEVMEKWAHKEKLTISKWVRTRNW